MSDGLGSFSPFQSVNPEKVLESTVRQLDSQLNNIWKVTSKITGKEVRFNIYKDLGNRGRGSNPKRTNKVFAGSYTVGKKTKTGHSVPIPKANEIFEVLLGDAHTHPYKGPKPL